MTPDKPVMPDTTKIEESIREMILNDDAIMDVIGQMVDIDIKARGLEPSDEIICMSQSAFIARILMNTATWFLG